MKFSSSEAAGLTATDLDLHAESPVLDRDSASDSTDFDGTTTVVESAAPEPGGASDDAGLDFNIEGISLDSGGAEDDKDQSDDSLSEMPALDLSGITLDLDGATTSTSSSGKDEKWYEVQTKFDLAKAYQEMGDKDGAKEILQEVISEGDSEQKAAAESVLATLD